MTATTTTCAACMRPSASPNTPSSSASKMALATLTESSFGAAVPRSGAAVASRAEADLQVTGLCKAFDATRPILKDVSLTVPQGQAVALVGANGAGKSTLLRCCLRLIEP